MADQAALERIKDFLGNGDTETAADMLLAATKTAHKEHYRSALLLKNRIETLQQNSIDGVLSTDEERLEWARISRGIIQLVEQVERNEAPKVITVAPESSAPPPAAPTKSGRHQKIIWWAIPLLLLGGFLFVPKFFIKSPEAAASESAPTQPKLQKMQGEIIYFDGKPVPGAMLSIEYLGKEFSAVSNENGSFTLEVDSTSLSKQVNLQVKVNGKVESEAIIRLNPGNLSRITLPR